MKALSPLQQIIRLKYFIEKIPRRALRDYNLLYVNARGKDPGNNKPPEDLKEIFGSVLYVL